MLNNFLVKLDIAYDKTKNQLFGKQNAVPRN
jgi:hypothetical protein